MQLKKKSKFPADIDFLCGKIPVAIALLGPNKIDIRILSLAKIRLLFVKGTLKHTT